MGKIGNYAPVRRVMVRACALAVASCAAAWAPNAAAAGFTLDNGDEGQWALGMSIGRAWRLQAADPNLISKPYGGNSSGVTQLGDLNFKKGDAYSTPLTTTGEVQLRHDNLGMVISGRAWYDYTLMNSPVPVGSPNNSFVPNTKLTDHGLYGPTKFSGLILGNAYVYGRFAPIADKPMTVKLGNQVVNWGESLFIPGVNGFGSFNVAASRQPGATVKDILMPIPQVSVNWGVADGVSLEAFYQLAATKSYSDGCGTFWSGSDAYNCGRKPLPLMGDDYGTEAEQMSGINAGGHNFAVTMLPDKNQKAAGQFGLAAHTFVTPLNADFGAYFVMYNQRAPIISFIRTPSVFANSVFTGNYYNTEPKSQIEAFSAMQGFWEYSATKIQTLAVSASTVLGGMTVSSELGYTKGIPVQFNSSDILIGLQLGTYLAGPPHSGSAGPLSYLNKLPMGSIAQGYDLHNKAQFQVNSVKIISQVLGADTVTIVGEAALQKWSGVGDPSDGTSPRYGRASTFGFGTTNADLCSTLNPNPANCVITGYATSLAWGYRVAAVFAYTDVFAGVNIKPRIIWSHDVKGVSPDGTFNQHRHILGLGARAEYLSKYYADVGYARYNANAYYDVLHDRDNVSVVLGVNF